MKRSSALLVGSSSAILLISGSFFSKYRTENLQKCWWSTFSWNGGRVLGVVLVRVISAHEKCLVYLHAFGSSGQFLPFCLAKHRATVSLWKLHAQGQFFAQTKAKEFEHDRNLIRSLGLLSSVHHSTSRGETAVFPAVAMCLHTCWPLHALLLTEVFSGIT